MVDLLNEDQPPTLSELEAARIDVVLARRRTVAWLMTTETPDVEQLLAEIVNRPSWHRKAACRGMETDLFFPERGVKLDAARSVCEGCSVRSECLTAALDAGPRTPGVWGGVSERGRRVLRRGAA